MVMLALLALAVSVRAVVVKLCDTNIPCQEIDVGTIDGSFDAAIAAQPAPGEISRLFVTTVVDSRNVDLAGHMVAHYTKLGIKTSNMLVILHGAKRDKAFETARAALKQLKIAPVEWIGQFSATTALYHRLKLLEKLAAPDWLVYVDMDEFIAIDGTLVNYVASLQRESYTIVSGMLVDRVAANGALGTVQPKVALADQFPLECQLTARLLKGSTTKLVLMRADFRASAGNHALLPGGWLKSNGMTALATTVTGVTKQHPKRVTIHHYKWTKHAVPMLVERVAYYKNKMRAGWWQESQRFLDQVEKTKTIPTETYCHKPVATKESVVERKPTPQTLIAQEWQREDGVKQPFCHTASKDFCIRPNEKDMTLCSSLPDAIPDVFERGFANAVATLTRGGFLTEFGAGYGCHSYFWATSLRFLGFNATDWRPESARRSKGRIRYVERGKEAREKLGADWIVTVGSRCAKREPLDCGDNLRDLVAHAYVGVVITPDVSLDFATASNASVDAAVADLTQRMDALGFFFNLKDTTTVRAASSLPVLRRSATVFERRQLMAQRMSAAFLSTKIAAVPWNNGVSFAGVWHRAFVPPTIKWHGYQVVIGVQSRPGDSKLRQAIRETWALRAKAFSCLVVFIVGAPTADVYTESLHYSDLILLEVVEIWSGEKSTLPLKSYALMQVATRYAVDALWIVKCDTDTFVYPDRLAALLRKYPSDAKGRYFVGAAFWPTPPIRHVPDRRSYVSHAFYPPYKWPLFMSGGAGYALSVELARCAAARSASADFWYMPLEDVSMGLTLREACRPFEVVDKNGFFNVGVTKPNNHTVTMHYVHGTHRIYDLWQPQMKV